MLNEKELKQVTNLVESIDNDILNIRHSLGVVCSKINDITKILKNPYHKNSYHNYTLTYEKYHEIVDPIDELGSMH